MSSLPTQMRNRWEYRSEPAPGHEQLYWHILFNDNPELQKLATAGQERLVPFTGLHLTPQQWLHLTVLAVGPAEDFTAADTNEMIGYAHQLLSGISPVKVTFSKVLYHPEAIVLGISPDHALDPVFTAIRDATHCVTERDDTSEDAPWIPHVTLAYSTSAQPAAPIIAALGHELSSGEVTIETVNLVIQDGPERLWNWRSIAEVPLGVS
jgi:2'-5' RNA ligase